jgi:hypothetical protein
MFIGRLQAGRFSVWPDDRRAPRIVAVNDGRRPPRLPKARGYRSPRNLMAIIYLLAGKLDLRLPACVRFLPTRNSAPEDHDS